MSVLEKIGLTEIKTNIANTGIVATVKGAGQGVTVAIRVPIDAVAINDQKNVPYKSRIKGMAHAC